MGEPRRLAERVLVRDPITDQGIWLEPGDEPDEVLAAQIRNPLVWEPTGEEVGMTPKERVEQYEQQHPDPIEEVQAQDAVQAQQVEAELRAQVAALEDELQRFRDAEKARVLAQETADAQAAQDAAAAAADPGPAGEDAGSGPGSSSPAPEVTPAPEAASYADLDRDALLALVGERELKYRANASEDSLRELLVADDTAKATAQPQE